MATNKISSNARPGYPNAPVKITSDAPLISPISQAPSDESVVLLDAPSGRADYMPLHAPNPTTADGLEVAQRMDASDVAAPKYSSCLVVSLVTSLTGIPLLSVGASLLKESGATQSYGAPILAVGVALEFLAAGCTLPAIRHAIDRYLNNHTASEPDVQVRSDDSAVGANMV